MAYTVMPHSLSKLLTSIEYASGVFYMGFDLKPHFCSDKIKQLSLAKNNPSDIFVINVFVYITDKIILAAIKFNTGQTEAN